MIWSRSYLEPHFALLPKEEGRYGAADLPDVAREAG